MCGRVSLVANLNNLYFIVCFGTKREHYAGQRPLDWINILSINQNVNIMTSTAALMEPWCKQIIVGRSAHCLSCFVLLYCIMYHPLALGHFDKSIWLSRQCRYSMMVGFHADFMFICYIMGKHNEYVIANRIIGNCSQWLLSSTLGLR